MCVCNLYILYIFKCRVTAGGCETFKEILTVLGTFDDGHIARDRLERACYNVMTMICEASRLRSVFREVVFRIVQNCASYQLDPELTQNIDNWKQMGSEVLKARLDGHMGLTEALNEVFVNKLELVGERKHKVENLGDLIDEHNGEILLIKFDAKLLGYTGAEIDEITDQARKRLNGGPADRRELDFTHEVV